MAFNVVRGRLTFFDAQIPRKTISQSFHSSLYVGKVLEQTSSSYHKNVPSSPDSNLFLPSINYYDFNEILVIKWLYLMILVTRNSKLRWFYPYVLISFWCNVANIKHCLLLKTQPDFKSVYLNHFAKSKWPDLLFKAINYESPH